MAIGICPLACSAHDAPKGGSPANSNHPPAAVSTASMIARGDSLYSEAEYDSARATYEAVVRVAATTNDSETVARTLTSLGLVAWKQGRFDVAKSIGEQSLALKRRLRLEKDVPRSLNALGLLAQNRGSLREALRLFDETRSAALAVHDSGYVLKARGNSGLAYQDLGDFDQARTEMIALRDGAAALGDTKSEANALNNLGALETRIGDPNRAIEWLTLARDRYEKLNSPVGLENALGQLGLAYAERGEPARALAYLDSALTIATRHGLLEPETDDLDIIAELYEQAGDETHALELLRRARALCDSLKMTTKLGHVALAEAHAFAALGNVRLARARAREAAALQRAVTARMEELDASLYEAEVAQREHDPSEVATSLAAARAAASSLGRGTARIKLALGTARVADLANDPSGVLAALDAAARDSALFAAEERSETESLRGRAYFRTKRFDLAVAAGRRAVSSLERIRGNFASGTQRTSYSAARVDVYGDLVVALLALGRTDEAFRVADAARGRGLIEHLGVARPGLRGAGSASDIAAADVLLRRIDALVARLRTSDSARSVSPKRSADEAVGDIGRELSNSRREYERLVNRIAKVDSGATILGANTVDVAAVRGSLAPHEALIEFLSTEAHLLIFVVRRDGLRWLEVPVTSGALAEHVHLARELIGARDTAANEPLRSLYRTLIEPVERERLLAGISSLVIVPHAALTYLPFAALRAPGGSEGPRYLVQSYSISVLSSASALPAVRAPTDRGPHAAATVLAPLPTELPATRAEAEAVARELVRPRLVVGASATETVLRRALQEASIVHVATHGTMNSESPMFSNIRLASPANDRTPEDNGRLETYEVLSLPVRSTLVFLSGCETALGASWSTTYNRRDDYATLAQAFLFAGARNVVATLWRVDDASAADFATAFYRDLKSLAPATALSSAQRAFIGDSRHALPYFWAAYTITGSGQLEPAAGTRQSDTP
jgi:CHAT domain-containing protein/tetratricopeptide (TPR) repeat protein